MRRYRSGREDLGGVEYVWDEGCFPLGGDSLALGAFATVRPGWRVCDLGCGAGALLLLLLGRERRLEVTGVELEPHCAALCRANLERNGLEGRVIAADLRHSGLPNGGFELVVSNPPYFAQGSGAPGGLGRMEEDLTLAELCAAAGRLLKNGGRFALVYPGERLTDLLCALRQAGLEPKRLQMVKHSAAQAPRVVLLEAVRQGRAGLEVLPDLIIGE